MSAGEVNKLPPGGRGRVKANDPISSLNEAWFHTLDRCIVNFPLSKAILPLMRNCFVAEATYAVLLLQKGHGDQLLRDIAGFSDEASPPVPPQSPLTRTVVSTLPNHKRKRMPRLIGSHCRNSSRSGRDRVER